MVVCFSRMLKITDLHCTAYHVVNSLSPFYFQSVNNVGSTVSRELSSFLVFPNSILRLTFLIDDCVCVFSFSRCIWQTINLI